MGNNFLGNGGTELNTTTGVMDLEYRQFDPVLGRMNQVDPLADNFPSHTPYNYSFNAPTVMNDPLGDAPLYTETERILHGLPMSGGRVMDYGTAGGGHVYPGSGGFWADGIRYSDWSLWGGSASYRYGLANGFTDLGGKMIDVGGGRYIDFNGEVKSVFSTISVYDIDLDKVPVNGQKTFFLDKGKLKFALTSSYLSVLLASAGGSKFWLNGEGSFSATTTIDGTRNKGLKILGSFFTVDPNKTVAGKILQVLSQLTWQLPQQLDGVLYAETATLFGGVESVKSFHGALLVRTNFGDGLTLGNIITNSNPEDDDHEWGHTAQSSILGPLYFPVIAIPSFVRASVITVSPNYSGDYFNFYTESWADSLWKKYHH